MTGRKFVRVWRDLSNDYPAVYDDPPVLGTYVQLLMDADALWEMRPKVPGDVDADALRALTDCGLVVTEDRGRYYMPDLDRWRTLERDRGRADAERRWAADRARKAPDGDPIGDPTGQPNAYKQTKPDQTRPNPRVRAQEASRKPGKNARTGELKPLAEVLTTGLKLGEDGKWVTKETGA